MKNFLLKFNHGVEIGAYLAYLGHWRRTREEKIFRIAMDELHHRVNLKHMLKDLKDKPSPFIDGCFQRIGSTIGFLCKYLPIWSLDRVARTMELFAIFNYKKLQVKYPYWEEHFKKMEQAERDHEKYFSRKKSV